jgi:hypothetical protein
MSLAWPLIVLLIRVLIAALLVNGLLMLLSPAVWQHTPWWFRSLSGIPSNRNPSPRSGQQKVAPGASLGKQSLRHDASPRSGR